ncbi:glutathione peroxidase [Abditibacterium utsteinense]|uniref:Glutathione peroxidase n=1 Tax=Abditibacterium utsteinense TaxID=1960156 RepID=A0A2S8ST86_9BACT|nr:glutathione peroxidase [Abditibacterium utsteinense]PQV64007.1 glutathione peroxidase [Abditibacterium utsteinense]
MKKPRILIIIAAIFLGSLALQMLLSRKAQSQPRKIAITKMAVAKKTPASKKMAAPTKIAVNKSTAATKVVATKTVAQTMPFYNFKLESLDGKPVDLAKYKGKTVLVVNTASKCGYTKQYAGLEALNQKYAKEGLAVLGFPANNFGGQEPGTNSEIGEFCQKNFGVKFDMFSKLSVKGDDQAPLFRYLTTEANPDLSGDIGWNFEKFLISRDGKLVARFKSDVAPEAPELNQAIEAELAKK